MRAQSKLYRIDKEFNIFNENVKKVVDLGYAPGNWSSFAKFRMEQVHDLSEDNFNKTCHILGFDLVFATPPIGVSTIQGNIYSKFSHKNIINHFKEVALNEYERLQSQSSQKDELDTSYYVKETSEPVIEDEDINKLSANLNKLTLMELSDYQKEQYRERQRSILQQLSYKPDLVLSDLAKPFMQQSGFFNNTFSRPYLRINSNEALNKPITDPLKSAIDLNDAALLLCCNLLRDGGAFVSRMSLVNHGDHELELYEERLRKVFNSVDIRSGSKFEIGTEMFFVGRNKKRSEEFNISDVFNK
jgi:23S rRNA (uridine2552-2'-O)-methyltransferase